MISGLVPFVKSFGKGYFFFCSLNQGHYTSIVFIKNAALGKKFHKTGKEMSLYYIMREMGKIERETYIER